MPAVTQRAIDAVWRIESAKLIAGVARVVRDLGVAEDIAQDALVSALERWPHSGIPERPGAWLASVARMRAIDHIRRNDRLRARQTELAVELERSGVEQTRDPANAPSPEIEDDVLRLIFIACHPVLSTDARVALTLRFVGGLTTDEIARAFLVPVATVAQRIVRAKRTLSEAQVPFELPPAPQRAERLASVLEVIYLVFNEGYSATGGAEWVRPGLCEDALRLGRVLAAHAPVEAEVHGLVALMEIQASRLRARHGRSGEPILLLDQDRGRWDHLLIGRGLAALAHAERLARPLGPYALQAAIAACHARARTNDETDWERIVALYDALAEIVPTPVVELNRAIAVGMAYGPSAGLELLDALAAEPALRSYPYLASARGDLLAKLGRPGEASSAFERAAALTANAQERTLLTRRARALAHGSAEPPSKDGNDGATGRDHV